MNENNIEIVKAYFAAFNAGDSQKMISLLHPDVRHDINQGHFEMGVEAFKKFMAHMDECYKEELRNMTIFSSDQPDKFSAQYDVYGIYLKTDGSLPPAHGQKYVIPAGSFLEIRDKKISRVTTYYNLPQWIEMVKK